jgi:hypothetical protein
MAQKSRATLKSYFQQGDIPTENEYIDLIDSIPSFQDHNSGDLKITGSLDILGNLTASNVLLDWSGSGVTGGLLDGVYRINTQLIGSADGTSITFMNEIDFNNQNLLNIDIGSGDINNTSIGTSTPSSGSFTTLSSTGNTNLGNSVDDQHFFIGGVTGSSFLVQDVNGKGDFYAHEITVGDRSSNSNALTISTSGSLFASSSITSSANISASGTLYGSEAYITGHITASGNISASGTIFADNFQSTGGDVGGISFADEVNITGNITASGNISASGTLFANTLNASELTGITHITASGNISSSGDLTINDIYIVEGKKIYFDGTDSTPNTYIDKLGVGLNFRVDDEQKAYFTQNTTKLLNNDVEIGTNAGGEGLFNSNLTVYGKITASGSISASGNLNAANITTPGTLTVGHLEATTINTLQLTSSIVTSSVIFSSGSNIFGDADSDTHTFNGSITASGDISSSGYLYGSRAIVNRIQHNNSVSDIYFANGINVVDSHITASGNISASGVITANDAAFDGTVIAGTGGTSTDGFKIGGDAGNIGYITNINGLRLQATSQDPTNVATPHVTVGIGGHITASGNISASGTIVGSNLSGTNTGDQNLDNLAITGSDVIFGNITASGNISASGTITQGNGLVAGVGRLYFSEFGGSNIHLSKAGSNLSLSNGGLATSEITASGNISASGTGSFGYVEASGLVNRSNDANTGLEFSSDTVVIQGNNVHAALFSSTLNRFIVPTQIQAPLTASSGISASHLKINSDAEGSFIELENGTFGAKIIASGSDYLVITSSGNSGGFYYDLKDNHLGVGRLPHINNASGLTVGGLTSGSRLHMSSHITASGNISASGDIFVKDLNINYDALPTSDPSVKGQVYRNGSNQLFVSAG